MANTLQQIKDGVAQEWGNTDWNDFQEYYIYWDNSKLEEGINQVAVRYAQEQNMELVEMLTECASVLRWTLDNAKPDSDWTTFTNSITNAMVASEELIKSATQIK